MGKWTFSYTSRKVLVSGTFSAGAPAGHRLSEGSRTSGNSKTFVYLINREWTPEVVSGIRRRNASSWFQDDSSVV